MQENCEVSVLLMTWGLEDLVTDFEDKKIDIEVFKLLTGEDIDKLIPVEKFGSRIKFRQRVFEWRRERGFVTPLADTLSLSSSASWLFPSENESYPNSPLSIENLGGTTVYNLIPSKESDSTNINSSGLADRLNLGNLLNSTLVGKSILEIYKKDGFLTQSNRNQLITIIIQSWLDNNHQPKLKTYSQTANQIKKIFPTEETESYLGSGGSRGTLKQRYYSLSKKFRNSGLVESSCNKKRITVTNAREIPALKIDCQGNSENSEELIQQNYLWLKNNKSPDSIVIEKWNLTLALRIKQGQSDEDIFTLWPILKQPIGSSLIELDFEKIYPSKSVLLFSKWSLLANKLIDIYKKEIKCSHSKALLKKLDGDINDDSRNFIIAILLNSIIKPGIVKTSKTECWRPSIADAQNSLAFYIKDTKDIPAKICKIKEKRGKQTLRVQPVIICVGESVCNLSRFLLYFDDVFYEADSFLKVLSLDFQLHYVLRIEYSIECQQVWHFLEHFIYEMPVSGKTSNCLTILLNNLN